MDNIKANRVKSYFIAAAKEIIINEGPENVSVRKIADLSGYSYGSIYNYYTELNELMVDVKNHMLQDLLKVMSMYLTEKKYEIEDIKELNHKLADYFINNQNIYKFFYIYEVRQTQPALYEQVDMGQIYWNTYKGLVEDGKIKKEDVPVIARSLVYGLYGLLSLYYSSNGLTKEKLHSDLDDMIEYMLKAKNDKENKEV